jgi:hypothetical protein
MFVDYLKGAPIKIEIYNTEGTIISTIELENQMINNTWLPKHIVIISQTIGGPGRTEITYEQWSAPICCTTS